MARKILVVGILSLLVLGASRASAFEIEPFIGMLSQDEDLGDERSPLYGLRFGGGARRIVTGETTLGYSPTANMHVVMLMGNLDVNIPVDPDIVPFLTIGTGTFIYIPKDEVEQEDELGIALGTQTQFSINYGGGLRYFFNPTMALRGDFRDNVVFDLQFDAAEGTEDNEIDIGTAHLIEWSLGLSFVFF
jgi:hypothetical protein